MQFHGGVYPWDAHSENVGHQGDRLLEDGHSHAFARKVSWSWAAASLGEDLLLHLRVPPVVGNTPSRSQRETVPDFAECFEEDPWWYFNCVTRHCLRVLWWHQEVYRWRPVSTAKCISVAWLAQRATSSGEDLSGFWQSSDWWLGPSGEVVEDDAQGRFRETGKPHDAGCPYTFYSYLRAAIRCFPGSGSNIAARRYWFSCQLRELVRQGLVQDGNVVQDVIRESQQCINADDCSFGSRPDHAWNATSLDWSSAAWGQCDLWSRPGCDIFCDAAPAWPTVEVSCWTRQKRQLRLPFGKVWGSVRPTSAWEIFGRLLCSFWFRLGGVGQKVHKKHWTNGLCSGIWRRIYDPRPGWSRRVSKFAFEAGAWCSNHVKPEHYPSGCRCQLETAKSSWSPSCSESRSEHAWWPWLPRPWLLPDNTGRWIAGASSCRCQPKELSIESAGNQCSLWILCTTTGRVETLGVRLPSESCWRGLWPWLCPSTELSEYVGISEPPLLGGGPSTSTC